LGDIPHTRMVPTVNGNADPLYQQVANRLIDLVEQGTLRPGERLPSVRRLHKQWGVSVSTVLEAYRVLEDRGVLDVRPQSGHYVRARAHRAPLPRAEPAPTTPRALDSDLMVRITLRAGQQGLTRLGCGLPERDLLPLSELDKVISRVARTCRDSHDYVVAPGHIRLRRALARRLVDAGCTLSPEDLVITNGCTEALDLCVRTLTKPGDTVVVESPTYFGLLEILRAQDVQVVEVPNHPETGVDVDAVARALEEHDVAAVVVSCNYTNPLGALVPLEQKRRLVALCTDNEVPLIEDDAYGDLGFEGDRPPSLKAFDTDGWVLSCGTLSKTLSPGLRIGWVAPGRFLSEICRRKLISTLAGATVPQLAAAEYLQNGGYDRQLRRLRRSYRSLLRQMCEAVTDRFPDGTGISRPRGGQFLWVELPEGRDAMELFEKAWDAGISIAPGPMFSPSGGYRSFFRLNGSVLWTPVVDEAITKLGVLAGSCEPAPD